MGRWFAGEDEGKGWGGETCWSVSGRLCAGLNSLSLCKVYGAKTDTVLGFQSSKFGLGVGS